MKQFSKYVGLDVHKAMLADSVARAGGEVRCVGEITNTVDTLKKLIVKRRKISAQGGVDETGTAPLACHHIYLHVEGKFN